MTRVKNWLAVAGVIFGILFAVSPAARAHDWDRDNSRDYYQERQHDREYWRDRDGRCFRRVWDPYRGWIIVQYYPQPRAWRWNHDHGRHLGWYKHQYREWNDRDDD